VHQAYGSVRDDTDAQRWPDCALYEELDGLSVAKPILYLALAEGYSCFHQSKRKPSTGLARLAGRQLVVGDQRPHTYTCTLPFVFHTFIVLPLARSRVFTRFAPQHTINGPPPSVLVLTPLFVISHRSILTSGTGVAKGGVAHRLAGTTIHNKERRQTWKSKPHHAYRCWESMPAAR
jgi:hypothetical protein